MALQQSFLSAPQGHVLRQSSLSFPFPCLPQSLSAGPGLVAQLVEGFAATREAPHLILGTTQTRCGGEHSNPDLRRQGWGDQKFKLILDYMMSSRSARHTGDLPLKHTIDSLGWVSALGNSVFALCRLREVFLHKMGSKQGRLHAAQCLVSSEIQIYIYI